MKEHQKNAAEQEKPVFTIMVDVFPKGNVQVRNFPANSMEQGMQVLAAGMIILAKHFRKQDAIGESHKIITLNNKQVADVNRGKLH